MKNEGGDFNNRKRPMGGRPMGGMQRGDGGRSMDDRIMEKLSQMVGPTYDLPPLDATEKKFSGRSRLYLGNLANETNDEDLTDLFKPYGETSELFLNKEKNFGFIKMASLNRLDVIPMLSCLIFFCSNSLFLLLGLPCKR